ncbi:MAG: FAD-binding and (Fe-S)-binding domain-containing protein, partial [Desulfobacteraceae bacterium]
MKFISPFYLNTLARKIKGDLYHDPLNRYLLSTDGSIFKDEPLAVIYPKSTEDVVETVRFARYHHLTVHPRGAGSGLCGSALGSGVVLDFSRYMHRLLSLDLSSQQFICEPGYRCGELSRTLKGSGLFFPPDPSSGEYASFGGMYATNASGAHSVKYGNVADYIVDAQIVLFTGEVVTLLDIAQTPLSELNDPFASLCDLYQKNASQIEKGYPNLRHNVAGYNLRGMLKGGRLQLGHLFSGAEGTLGVVTRLTFKLLPKPVHDSLVVAFFDNIGAAAKAVKALLPSNPAGIEVMDKSLLELARASDEVLQRKIPDGIDNVLLIEFDGETSNQTNALGQQAKDLLLSEGFTKNVSLATSENEKQKFWAVRKAAVPILYRLKGEKKILALIEDAVVPTDQLEAYFKGLYEILEKYKVRFVLYGHIAKGLIHTRPLLNLKNPAHIELLKTIADEVFSLVHGLGGVVSGEHGDGRLRSTYIARQYPSIYPFFVAVKEILDPEHMFNPDIKTSNVPDQMRRNLRYGEKYRRYENLPLQLNFDDGFLDEIEKCHGCSKCTTITTATRMCPIYKFTRLEAAAPKAKANVLRALISGAIGTDAIYEKTFQSIINLCVNCGSCKIECPSHVNIPQLALEARSRFVAKKGAPFSHHLLTRVET